MQFTSSGLKDTHYKQMLVAQKGVDGLSEGFNSIDGTLAKILAFCTLAWTNKHEYAYLILFSDVKGDEMSYGIRGKFTSSASKPSFGLRLFIRSSGDCFTIYIMFPFISNASDLEQEVR